MKSLSCTHVLEGHESWLRTIDLYSGLVLTGSGDNTARVWNLTSGVHENTLLGHADWIHVAYIHRQDDNTAVTASWDCTVRTWNVHTGTCLKSISCHSPIRCMCDTNNKLEVVVGCINGSVTILDLSVGCIRLQLLSPSNNPINSIAARHGRIVAATSDSKVHVWSCNGPSLGIFHHHSAHINSVCIALDGVCFSVDGNGCINAWDMLTQSVLFEEDAKDPALCCIATGNDETTSLICGLEEYVASIISNAIFTLAGFILALL